MGETIVGVLRGDQLFKHWPFISKALEEVPPQSMWLRFASTEEVLNAAIGDDIQIWGAGEKELDLIVITRPLNYEGGTILRIEYAYGADFDKYAEKLMGMADYMARVLSCSKIVLVGRLGWMKKLKSHGFEVDGVLLSKNVSKGSLN